ncbi:unnamed protein product [Blepharisma stoltei]|uniref:Uncharacterized protein n=1 Tax=Blepharisma stoltei TaxID=1481888 RepID=A0AAU9JXL0_9CILI|nr:unnamed protein product [Blepharisma stoltei]
MPLINLIKLPMQPKENTETICSLPSIISYSQTMLSCAQGLEDDYIDTQSDKSDETTVDISLYSTRNTTAHFIENTQQPSCHCELF